MCRSSERPLVRPRALCSYQERPGSPPGGTGQSLRGPRPLPRAACGPAWGSLAGLPSGERVELTFQQVSLKSPSVTQHSACPGPTGRWSCESSRQSPTQAFRVRRKLGSPALRSVPQISYRDSR